MHKPIRWLVSAFVAYAIIAYLLLYVLNWSIPAWLELTIVIIAMPLQLIVLPWLGLLQNLGLTNGEWIRQPSLTGMALIVVLYAFVLYLIAWLMALLWKRFKHGANR